MIEGIYTETLYGKSSSGKILVWSIMAVDDYFQVVHGQKDGKMQSKKTHCKAKNIGKANETAPEQQAVIEAKAKAVAQRKKGYYDTEEEAESHVEFTPMKLANFKDYGGKIKFPCAYQTKLNGMRYMVTKDGSGLSKQGEKIFLPEHIQRELDILVEQLGDSFVGLDGEIYAGNSSEGGISLQKIISAFRKPNEDTALLKYYIYNIPDCSKIFYCTKNHDNRLVMLRKITTLISLLDLKSVVVLPTTIVFNIDRLDYLYNNDLKRGEEGGVIHNFHGVYEFGKRSYNSQKRKLRQDAEALVVSVEEDNNGQGVLSCIAANGLQEGSEFKCLMRKDSDVHKNYRLYENALQLVGTHITYQYEELSDDLVPTKPCGVALRELDSLGNPKF